MKSDGKVEEGNTGIVTGDTVYNETRVKKDGNYIKKDNSAAENITVLDEKVKDNSTRIDNIANEFGNMDNRMKKGLAGAAALAALHPMDFDPDDKLTFAAGMGNYRGENAAAIGAFYRPDEKVMFSIGGTVGNGENMVNAGVSFSLDRVNRVSNSRTAMAHEIVELRDHIAKQDTRIAKQDEQIARLTDLVNRLAGPELQMKDTVMFPDVPENHWAYEYLDDLQKRGVIEGYPNGQFMGDRAMTRYEFAAMLDRALRKGISLDARAAREFGPELDYIHEQSRVRVDRITGQDSDRYKIERVRVNNEDKATRDIYGSKMPVAKAAKKAK